MRAVPLRLAAGADLRPILEEQAKEQGASGFVLAVVGDLSQATFRCPGRGEPTLLRGPLEILSLSGTVAPGGAHLHISVSDGHGRVWGGHLEPGSLVLKGAEVLVGLLPAPAEVSARIGGEGAAALTPAGPRVEIAVLPGCPFSARAVRLLRTLGIPHRLETVASEAQRSHLRERSGHSSLPQVFIDDTPIGGYDALVEWHGRGELEALRGG